MSLCSSSCLQRSLLLEPPQRFHVVRMDVDGWGFISNPAAPREVRTSPSSGAVVILRTTWPCTEWLVVERMGSSIGGELTSDPAIVTRGDRCLRVRSWQEQRDVRAVSDDEHLVGLVVARRTGCWRPCRGRRQQRRHLALHRAVDNALWFRRYSGGVWGAWTTLGGNLTADPEVVAAEHSLGLRPTG